MSSCRRHKAPNRNILYWHRENWSMWTALTTAAQMTASSERTPDKWHSDPTRLSRGFLTPGNVLCANSKFILESSCGLLPGCFVWPAICLVICAPSSGDRLFLQITWWEHLLQCVTLLRVTVHWMGSEDESKVGIHSIESEVRDGRLVPFRAAGHLPCECGRCCVYDMWEENKTKTEILKERTWGSEGEASFRFSSLPWGQASLSLASPSYE